LRRANDFGPRSLDCSLDAALWRNVCRSGRYLSRRLRGVGLEASWVEADERASIRTGELVARLSGSPGELLLYLFGRQAVAQVEVSCPALGIDAVNGTLFGM